MSRFYVKPSDIKNNNIHISGEEAHHVLDVMRLKKGDSIAAFDGEGKEFEGVIKEVKKSEVIMEIIKTRTLDTQEAIHITLAQAIPKKAKIDYIIEKCVELGVSRIIPITTNRTLVKFDNEKSEAKLKRWEKIIVSASKQCGRLTIPRIEKLTSVTEVIKDIDKYDLPLMACLYKDTKELKELISGFKGKKIIIFIGPEGDFTAEEIGAAKNKGAKLISLGPRVLKTDTAALNLVSILQYELG